jgi:hypothetical protein
VFYWVFAGTNGYILKHHSLKQIAEAISQVSEQTQSTPLLVGAAWDKEDDHLKKLNNLLPKNTIDLRGKTTLEELFGLMRGSQAVVGMASGITIMSGVFGVKTIMVIHDYLTTNGVHKDFSLNICPPKTLNKTYFPVFAEDTTTEGLIAKAVSIIKDSPYQEAPEHVRSSKTPLNRLPLPLRSAVPTVRDYEKPVSRKDWKTKIDNMSKAKNPGNSTPEVAVVCVLKENSPYDISYVLKLRSMVARNTTVSHEFICLTDVNIDPSICKTVKLRHGLDLAWSRLEAFKKGITKAKRIMYLDLSTVIVGNIDHLLRANQEFLALKPWNRINREKGLFSTALMGWKNGGTYSLIYEKMTKADINNYAYGEKQFIKEMLDTFYGRPTLYQEKYNGIYSYKRDCKVSLPQDARLVCFHGRPLPHQSNKGWVRQHWR